MFYYFDCSKLPTITSFYSVTRNTVWQISENTHILLYISSGTCSITMDSTDYLLEKGDVFYIPADHSYTRRSIDNTMCTMTYVHFLLPSATREENACTLAKEMQNQRKVLEEKTLSGEQNPHAPAMVYLQNKHTLTQNGQEVSELFDKILHTSTNRHLMHNMTLSIYLCRIFLLLSRNTIDLLLTDDTIQNTDPVPKNLKRAIEYIIANYTKPITLDDLSRQCNVSRQQVIRYFKSALNTTPIQYINHYRLSKAKELLFRQPQLNIKEIAAELGFENQHYFTRLFSATYGETPSHYRERAVNYDIHNE